MKPKPVAPDPGQRWTEQQVAWNLGVSTVWREKSAKLLIQAWDEGVRVFLPGVSGRYYDRDIEALRKVQDWDSPEGLQSAGFMVRCAVTSITNRANSPSASTHIVCSPNGVKYISALDLSEQETL